MAEPIPRVFHLRETPSMPLSIGRKGASWLVVFSRPYGMRKNRMHACINVEAYLEQKTPDGHRHFRFNNGTWNASLGLLEQLLAIEPPIIRRRDSHSTGNPDVALLLPDAEVLQCCASCEEWESTGRPRYQRCSTCKLRYYCSSACQKAGWRKGHRQECGMIEAGQYDEVEQRRPTHVFQGRAGK
ncbi:hypothetical protein B0H11DRAFT_1180253 [Mycena galericulata]|nr:hypothetical protein B0H11DRAFT_1180253 [Mycena galericulata]